MFYLFVELSFSNNHSISFDLDDFNRVILFDVRPFCNDIYTLVADGRFARRAKVGVCRACLVD